MPRAVRPRNWRRVSRSKISWYVMVVTCFPGSSAPGNRFVQVEYNARNGSPHAARSLIEVLGHERSRPHHGLRGGRVFGIFHQVRVVRVSSASSPRRAARESAS